MGIAYPMTLRRLASFSLRTRVAESGCWDYIGVLNQKGYGMFNGHSAYRVAFEWWKGPVAAGLVIDHLCSNRACVNPAHLEAVTTRENNRRAAERRTHCRYGHARSRYWVAKFNSCNECHRLRSAAFYAKNRARILSIRKVA